MNFSKNNFDLLRLFAAANVALIHVHSIMGLQFNAAFTGIIWVTSNFPGVPIFYFISGFLISKSFERSSRLGEYCRNRVFRIYPALIVSIFVTLLIIQASGYLLEARYSWRDIAILILAKGTILQFYNQDFLRGFGDGVFNGSLWTITVELQFYALVPLVYLLKEKLAKAISFNRLLLALIGVFLGAFIAYDRLEASHADSTWLKLIGVSFIPWFYMFLTGIFAQRNFEFFAKWLGGKAMPVTCLYVAVSYLAVRLFSIDRGNQINPLVFFCLCACVFSLAYSFTGVSRSLLRGHDVSYGIYIYHMPVINYLLYTAWYKERFDGALGILGVLAMTICLALASWLLIEKPFLSMKKKSIKPIAAVIPDTSSG